MATTGGSKNNRRKYPLRLAKDATFLSSSGKKAMKRADEAVARQFVSVKLPGRGIRRIPRKTFEAWSQGAKDMGISVVDYIVRLLNKKEKGV